VFVFVREPLFFIVEVNADDTEPEQDIDNVVDFFRLDSSVFQTLRGIRSRKDNGRTYEGVWHIAEFRIYVLIFKTDVNERVRRVALFGLQDVCFREFLSLPVQPHIDAFPHETEKLPWPHERTIQDELEGILTFDMRREELGP
jgi:hypothetical protein